MSGLHLATGEWFPCWLISEEKEELPWGPEEIHSLLSKQRYMLEAQSFPMVPPPTPADCALHRTQVVRSTRQQEISQTKCIERKIKLGRKKQVVQIALYLLQGAIFAENIGQTTTLNCLKLICPVHCGGNNQIPPKAWGWCVTAVSMSPTSHATHNGEDEIKPVFLSSPKLQILTGAHFHTATEV